MADKQNKWLNEYGVDIRVQKIALNLLLAFDDFCKSNNLKYYLQAGTLLGAIRDGGIIPWDDDIDVSMPREDYEKLLSIGKGFAPHYRLASYKTIEDSSYPYQWAKLEDTRTHIVEKIFPRGRKGAGVFIDIFPLDTVPDFIKAQKEIIRKAIKWKIYLLSYYNYYDTRPYLRWFWPTLKILLQLRYKNGNALHTAVDKAFVNKYKGSYLGDLFGWDMEGIALQKNYGDTHAIDFEGFSLKCPENPIALLDHAYGDWRNPPPVEKRKPAHGFSYEIPNGIYLEYLDISL